MNIPRWAPWVVGGLLLVGWGQQCGRTAAARAAAEREAARLSGEIESLDQTLADLSVMNSELRVENLIVAEAAAAARDSLATERTEAERRRREAAAAADAATLGTDETIDLIEQALPPEAKPLAARLRTNLSDERLWRSEVVAAVERERDIAKEEGQTFRRERDAARLLVAGLEAEVVTWRERSLLADSLAAHWEREYRREVRTGIFDIGIPDWVGVPLAAGVGYVAGRLMP